MSGRRQAISNLLALLVLLGWLPRAHAIITDPVSWWKLDETSGTTAADSGSANLPATLNNFSVPADWLGTDQGLNFDGTDAYLSRADNAAYDFSTDMAISLWVWFDALPSTRAQEARLIWKTHNTTPFLSFQMYVTTANAIQLDWRNTATTLYSTGGSAISPVSQWHHIVYTKSGATAKIYLNNVDVTIGGTGHTGTMFLSDGVMHIGAQNATTNRLDGRMRQIRLFSHSLDATDVGDLFTYTEGAVAAAPRRGPLVFE